MRPGPWARPIQRRPSAANLQDRFQKNCPARGEHFRGGPVEGLVRRAGFKIIVQDARRQRLCGSQKPHQAVLAGPPAPARPLTTSRRYPWWSGHRSRQAKDRGVSMRHPDTLGVPPWGLLHQSDFNRFGRTWQVNAKTWTPSPVGRGVKLLQVRKQQNQMVPAADFASVAEFPADRSCDAHNMYPSAAVTPTPGRHSSGRPSSAWKRRQRQLPRPCAPKDELPSQRGHRQYRWKGVRAGVSCLPGLGAHSRAGLSVGCHLVVRCACSAPSRVVMTRWTSTSSRQVGLVQVGLAARMHPDCRVAKRSARVGDNLA